MIKSKKINKAKIKPVITSSKDSSKNCMGYDYIPTKYANCVLYGRKKSGKTTVLYNLLKNRLGGGHTKEAFIFCSSHEHDPTWTKIIGMLLKKGIDVHAFHHFIGPNKENVIDEFIQQRQDEREMEKEKKEQKEMPVISRPMFGGMAPVNDTSLMSEPEEKKKCKSKRVAPEFVMIFDDLSASMRHPSISKLLTFNRHFHCDNYISCHSVKNLTPDAHTNVDCAIVFPKFSPDAIEHIATKMECSFPQDTNKKSHLQDLYQQATSPEKYSFLVIDKVDCSYRKCFDELLLHD